MIQPVRRVVVATGPDGAPAVTFDGPSPHVHALPGMSPDLGLTDLWRTDPARAAAPTDDVASGALAVAPPPGGTLFRIVQLPPDADDPAAPFWHETPTTDYNVVLAGELTFLAESLEVVLAAGDTIVVEGGRHAWSNRSQSPARLAAVSVDTSARRR